MYKKIFELYTLCGGKILLLFSHQLVSLICLVILLLNMLLSDF
ncbi:hypothetical protein Gotri_004208 [Gossypium trilobum]|uniref:Uncharacterized protein n=1 Tax=Gossypium trilobum TaxID=34281 RepID=A0A7J9F659_9ROSI|nr:hypothetical protein [Gossypium trilobum]